MNNAPSGNEWATRVFLGVWPATIAAALIGTFAGLMWVVPWWPALYAVPVLTWTAGGTWWWVHGPTTTWQRAAKGFAQAHVGALLFIETISLSGVAGHMLLSTDWFPLTAGIGGIGGFYLIGFSVGALPVLPGPLIALAWARHGGAWPRLYERAATTAIGAWTGLCGLGALTLSA